MRRSKYRPLQEYLDLLSQDDPARKRVELSFNRIEQIIGKPLPRSAYDYSSWWGNRWGSVYFNKYSPPHTSAWHDAGWFVVHLDLSGQLVEFGRD